MSDLINTNVIHPMSIMLLYDVLITQALEDNTSQLCSDWLVYIVMYSLPWVTISYGIFWVLCLRAARFEIGRSMPR